MYAYSFTLGPTKTVQSVTLPNNPDLEILAVDVIPAASNGVFTFTNVKPGTYTIAQETPSDWLQLSPATGSYAFGSPTTVGLPTTPVAMTSLDLNGDGYTDLAVLSNDGDINLNFYLNDGDGGFTLATAYLTAGSGGGGSGTTTLSFAAASSNDGYDLVALDGFPAGFADASSPSLGVVSIGGKLYVVRNDTTPGGNPTFYIFTSESAELPGVDTIYGFGTADFNNDGETDIAGSYTGSSGPTQLAVHLMGESTEGTSQTEEFAQVSKLAVGDLNLDGNQDIVWYAGHSSDRGVFQILYGNGDGTFGNNQQYSVDAGNGSGTFPPSVKTAGNTQIAIADLNDDGLPDIVLNASYGDSGPYYLTFFEQNTLGDFVQVDDTNWITTNYRIGDQPFSVNVANFLGTDFNTLVWMANYGGWSLNFFGDGNGDLTAETGSSGQVYKYALGYEPADMEVFDANLDGLPDVILLNAAGNQLVVLPNASARATSVTTDFLSGGNNGPSFVNAQTSTGVSAAATATTGFAASAKAEEVADAARAANVTGVVYDDRDLHGTRQPAEGGLGGVTVFLDQNGNGVPDPGEWSTATNPDGAFGFAGIADGTYRVTAVLPAGYLAADQDAIAQPVVVLDGRIVSDTPALIELGMALGQQLVRYTDSVDAGVDWTLRAAGAYFQIVDNSTGRVIQSGLLGSLYGVDILASNFTADAVTVDLSRTGAFALSGGIHVAGGRNGAGGGSVLRIVGSPADAVTAFSPGSAVVDDELLITWTDNVGVVFDIAPAGTPAYLTVTGGSAQRAVAATAFAVPLQVRVTDRFGNPVPGVLVSFTAPAAGPRAALSAAAVVTDANGVASVTAFAGTDAGSYTVLATVGSLSAAFALTNLSNLPSVIGPGPGGGPVIVTNPDGTTRFSIDPYPGFTGGVHVAAGDLNGDGLADIVTGAGPGGPQVAVSDGGTGVILRSLFAYDPTFRGGVSVAAGDVNGNGIVDIATGVGPGGGPNVNIFDGATSAVLQSFYAYDPAFTGGVFVG
ncbi:MAG: FG-GAP-like repeat-containing protein [Gemmataceae bacterium]|nr:FG-GAP-like repeat-containing protein [Gemmataceae bacterium]